MAEFKQIIEDALDILKFDGAVQDTLAELREKWGAQVPALLEERLDMVAVQYMRLPHEKGAAALGQELSAFGWALYNLDDEDEYLPFGDWNECPGTQSLMAVAKYWFEQYGAVPAVMTHDELEFLLPTPVSQEKAMDAAVEQYGFCPDVIDQGPEEATVGALADVLRQSTVWYLWWD